MASPKKSREELDRIALSRHLLKLEPLGVLHREICPFPIPTEEEDPGLFGERHSKKWGVLPPRLFFIPKYNTLVHCYGDDKFYDLYPEFYKGGLSKECYVLDEFPRFLSNQYALEGMLDGGGKAFPYDDPLSLRSKKMLPMGAADRKVWKDACSLVVAERISETAARKAQRIRLVKDGGGDGKAT